MIEAVGVAQFVDHLGQHPSSKEALVFRLSVEGLPEPREGDDGPLAGGLAEDKI